MQEYLADINPASFEDTNIKIHNLPVVRIDEAHKQMLDSILTRFNTNYSAFVRGFIEAAYGRIQNKNADATTPAKKKSKTKF